MPELMGQLRLVGLLGRERANVTCESRQSCRVWARAMHGGASVTQVSLYPTTHASQEAQDPGAPESAGLKKTWLISDPRLDSPIPTFWAWGLGNLCSKQSSRHSRGSLWPAITFCSGLDMKDSTCWRWWSSPETTQSRSQRQKLLKPEMVPSSLHLLGGSCHSNWRAKCIHILDGFTATF